MELGNRSDDINLDSDSCSSDDFFGNQCEDDESSREEMSLMERERVAMCEKFENIGFREAFEESHEEKLQEGFILGYRSSASGAFETGSMFGRICANAVIIGNSIDAKSSEKAKNSAILPAGEGDCDQLHASAIAGRIDAARAIHEFFTKMLQKSDYTKVDMLQKNMNDIEKEIRDATSSLLTK